MKYKCLVFDHDDTTVDSTRNIHYPSFCAYMRFKRPEINITLEEYIKLNFHPGIVALFKDICHLSDEDMKEEAEFWLDYQKSHYSRAFDGIKEIMDTHKASGGLIVVVSHSYASQILKDYKFNELPLPDMIFGWEQPKEERKPAPVPIYKIMEQYGLEKDDILVIDDLKPGLDMARSAGVSFAGAGWCFDIPENEAYLKANGDYYFKTVKELKDFLEY